MSVDLLDELFQKNGFHEAVMNDIRRGITFSSGHGLSFQSLVKSLHVGHSLEEIDNYDALRSIPYFYDYGYSFG